MSENTPPRSTEQPKQLSAEANARRLMMLKGLGRGSAVVSAAALPLSALSQGSTLLLTPTGKGGEEAGLRCSVSGMQSKVANSRIPSDARTCGGYSPGWWGQEAENNGKIVPRRTWPIDYKTKCTSLFTRYATDDPGMSGLFTNGVTLFDVMRKSEFASTKTRHWIGAYLNGLSGGVPGFPFPYSGAEVMKFYNTMDQKRDQFYALVVTYLEIHN
ncbi:hypothetical protein [Hydrogenophaga sp. PBL-H3]|uniref:hypothetical protein n=1 Tax=Hydrogenophaga sp. PBL-H3 TaxID=434010 RepID=UPI00131FE7A8|nr:hypothetical protein [Hydrogenophaga sp. PBL-H3]QHE76683.1 hypothetical protein F9Z45_11755 [Hydrogenophaga sp. PBL-H3]QHE81107.1 hypothetical protein F9Z44_11755 [Hydrogenophaga sp. PBL-H3]